MERNNIKLERGFVLKKGTNNGYLIFDTNLDVFLNGQNVKLSTLDGKFGWLNVYNDNKQTSSIWLSRPTTIKRVKKFMEA